MFKERLIPSRRKVIIYQTIRRPEHSLYTLLRSKIQAAEMRVLHLIKGVTRRDRLRSDEVRDEFNIESVLKEGIGSSIGSSIRRYW